MVIDLLDNNLRIRHNTFSGGRARLTIDYPAGTPYRERIMQALGDLLRPTPAEPPFQPTEPQQSETSG